MRNSCATRINFSTKLRFSIKQKKGFTTLYRENFVSDGVELNHDSEPVRPTRFRVESIMGKFRKIDYLYVTHSPLEPKYDGDYMDIQIDASLKQYAYFYNFPSLNIDWPAIESQWTLPGNDVVKRLQCNYVAVYCRSTKTSLAATKLDRVITIDADNSLSLRFAPRRTMRF